MSDGDFGPVEYIRDHLDELGPLIELKSVGGRIRWPKSMGVPDRARWSYGFTIKHTLKSVLEVPERPPRTGVRKVEFTIRECPEPYKWDVPDDGSDEHIVGFSFFPYAREGTDEKDSIHVIVSSPWSPPTRGLLVYPYEVEAAPPSTELDRDFFVLQFLRLPFPP